MPKFKPKFSGSWYGIMLAKGETVDLTGSLAAKAANQSENFERAIGRPKKSDDKNNA